jgi:hypothetical protein
MFVCMHVCIRVCVYLCMYVCMICTHVCMYVCYVRMYVCMNVCYVYMYVCMYLCMCLYVRVILLFLPPLWLVSFLPTSTNRTVTTTAPPTPPTKNSNQEHSAAAPTHLVRHGFKVHRSSTDLLLLASLLVNRIEPMCQVSATRQIQTHDTVMRV